MLKNGSFWNWMAENRSQRCIAIGKMLTLNDGNNFFLYFDQKLRKLFDLIVLNTNCVTIFCPFSECDFKYN